MNNKEFGYVLGVIYGDGWLDKNSIILNVKDKDFAMFFKFNLEKLFNKETKLHYYNNLWRVLLHSRNAVKTLRNFDYHKISNLSQETKCAFLKGFFDSEGSAYYFEKIGVRNRKIELCNTNLDLLLFCKNILQEIGIKSLKIDRRVRKERKLGDRILQPTLFYRFTIVENKENLERFRDLIGFSIERKRNILEKIINSYILPHRNKWISFKNDVLNQSMVKRYSDLRKQFSFIPKGVIDYWIYPKNREYQE